MRWFRNTRSTSAGPNSNSVWPSQDLDNSMSSGKRWRSSVLGRSKPVVSRSMAKVSRRRWQAKPWLGRRPSVALRRRFRRGWCRRPRRRIFQEVDANDGQICDATAKGRRRRGVARLAALQTRRRRRRRREIWIVSHCSTRRRPPQRAVDNSERGSHLQPTRQERMEPLQPIVAKWTRWITRNAESGLIQLGKKKQGKSSEMMRNSV